MSAPEVATDQWADRLARVALDLQALNLPAAVEAAGQAVALATTQAQRAQAHYWLAKCHYVAGDIDVAMRIAADTRRIAAAAGEAVWSSQACTLQARCLDAAGEPQAALDHALLALAELEQSPAGTEGADHALQGATIALGIIYLTLGDLPLALQWCERSVEMARSLPDATQYGAALDTVACVRGAMAGEARGLGQAELAERLEREAIALSTRAVELARRHGHVDYETSALLNLAESHALVGEPQRALALLQAWAQAHPAALPRQRAHQLDTLGSIHLKLGDAASAIRAFEEALAIGGDSLVHRAVILEHLASALEAAGRWQDALGRFKEFHVLQMQLGAERAKRNARVAAMRADVESERARARVLAADNSQLLRRAEDLHRLASEDPLTGLANRRHIDTLLLESASNLWWAAIDVDHFKRVNDDFSHATGDSVLKELAGLMRKSCRPNDVAARVGGEEFVLLYRGGPNANVLAAAERLRAAAARHPWNTIAPGLSITISIGLAHSTEAADGPALAALADRRLYAAKHAGRNRVVAGG